jgi:hypothetical protein
MAEGKRSGSIKYFYYFVLPMIKLIRRMRGTKLSVLGENTKRNSVYSENTANLQWSTKQNSSSNALNNNRRLRRMHRMKLRALGENEKTPNETQCIPRMRQI